MGYLHVYTGNGKGKTTAAFGLVLRSAGRSRPAFVGQFLKHQASGEVMACRSLPGVQVELFGALRRVGDAPREEDVQAAQRGLRRIAEVLAAGTHSLVVLDEVNVALSQGLLDLEETLRVLGSRGPDCEVVATGRYAPQRLLEAADLVTEMQDKKHYARSGVPARTGIEL